MVRKRVGARARRGASRSAGRSQKPSVISLFTCGMGLDLGFERAGFSTKYSNDITGFACNTIRKNRPHVPCDEGDITDITSREILKSAGLRRGQADVVIGGPPCQSFSSAGKRRGFKDKRGFALLQYLRVIRDVRPKFFVFENVPGIMSAAKNHVPFYVRNDPKSRITRSQQYGSLFTEIIKEFESLRGYDFEYRKVNAADYGVPQKRKRFILVGTRTSDPVKVFEEIEWHGRYADPRLNTRMRPWRTLRDALEGLKDPDKEHVNFPKWGRYLRYVPPGGCWTSIPKRLQARALGGAADSDDPRRVGSQGGRTGFYRRLSWDAPSPTLVTSPVQKGSCLCHPDETRPLTVREYARIQGFPDTWKFVGSTAQKYRMIGEAVPVQLGSVIARSVKRFL